MYKQQNGDIELLKCKSPYYYLSKYSSKLMLSVLGKTSLEILLVSDYLFANFSKLGIVIFSNRIISIFIVVISLFIGIAFHYCADSIIKRVNQSLKSRKEKG